MFNGENASAQKNNSSEAAYCQNRDCSDKRKIKYPGGRRKDKSVDPGDELVTVELISIENPNYVIATALVCFLCLGHFTGDEVRRRMSELPITKLAVHWRYYADNRYVSASLFAQKLPGVFENIST